MRISQNLLRVYNMLMKTPSSSPSSVIITIISSSWHLLYNFHRKISRMVRNNFMMHLCTVATLCFFKITFPRNYYYCDQDDTFPWVCVLKYVSNSNCCHRHLELYIFDVQKFPYLSKYIYHQTFQYYVLKSRTCKMDVLMLVEAIGCSFRLYREEKEADITLFSFNNIF